MEKMNKVERIKKSKNKYEYFYNGKKITELQAKYLIGDQVIEEPDYFYLDIQNKKSKLKKLDDTICNYGTKIVDIDDYDFKIRRDIPLKTLLSNLNKSISEGEQFIIKKSEVLVPKLFMRDILTKYVVQNIFENKAENKLIHIINKIMKSLYSEYKKQTGIELMFVYRGGNILKLYKDNFENYLPGNVRAFFKKEFSEFFKSSDLDFYTVIKGSETMANKGIGKINNDIRMLCYYGCYIARIIIMNTDKLFQFCKFNEKTLSEQYQKIIEDINKEKYFSVFDTIKNSNFFGIGFNHYFYSENNKIETLEQIGKLPNKKLSGELIPGIDEADLIVNLNKYKKPGKFDTNIVPTETETYVNKIKYKQENIFEFDFSQDMEEIVYKNKIFDFYITNNRKILNVQESIDFSLVRLMINFIVTYETKDGKIGVTNAPSELYDLSIGHPGDKMYNVYVSSNLSTYKFQYDDNEKDQIYIPTIHTTLLDLINILFEYREFPWLDSKYEKRLYRLLILIFIDQLTKKSIYQLKKELVKISNQTFKANPTKKQIETLNNIDFKIIEHKNNEIIKKITKENEQKYEEYKNLYYNIINKLLHIVNEIETFVKSQGKLGISDIYL